MVLAASHFRDVLTVQRRTTPLPPQQMMVAVVNEGLKVARIRPQPTTTRLRTHRRGVSMTMSAAAIRRRATMRAIRLSIARACAHIHCSDACYPPPRTLCRLRLLMTAAAPSSRHLLLLRPHRRRHLPRPPHRRLPQQRHHRPAGQTVRHRVRRVLRQRPPTARR